MDLEKKYQERHELLAQMQDELEEGLIACELTEPEEIESEEQGEVTIPEMLHVVVDGLGEEGMIGEFFFQPLGDETDKVQYFTVLLTLADELKEEKLPALFEAMSYANVRVLCGAFYVDEDKEFLFYKMTIPLPVDLSRDDLYKQMNIAVGNSIAAASEYREQLVELACD